MLLEPLGHRAGQADPGSGHRARDRDPYIKEREHLGLLGWVHVGQPFTGHSGQGCQVARSLLEWDVPLERVRPVE
ncbi:hypothetical protein ACFWOJ_03630 [Streptomyces sp. NPDC058439]|uniref:hypothetical protein n=1 Tax=Streptomyces sp. NPDC058439 TaxID=3346500 RepID=UPI00364C6FDA